MLEPRVMHVLVTLADVEPGVLSRDALLAGCWRGRFVGEDAVNRAIGELRRALRTATGDILQIETIPRIGYRLVCNAPEPSVSAAAPEPSVSAAAAPTSRIARRTLIAAGFAAAAVGTGVGWYVWPRRAPDVAALIVQGDQALRQGLPDADTQGAGFYAEATRRAPDDAEAWGRLAVANATVAEYAGPAETASAVAACMLAAGRALALDPGQADARAALAIVPPMFGDWMATRARLKAVLADHAENLPAELMQGMFLMATGQVSASDRFGAVLAAREPLHPIVQFRRVYHNWSMGRIEAMHRQADRILLLWPRHPAVWFARLWTLAFAGRPDHALVMLDDADSRPAMPPDVLAALRRAVAALAGEGSAAAAIVANLASAVQGPSRAVSAIMCLSALGAIDDAMAVAQSYLLSAGPLHVRMRHVPGDLSINDQRRRKTMMLFVPVSAPLRAHPGFPALMAGAGLTDYWRLAGVTPDYLARR